MESRVIQKTPTQHSEYDFHPDFISALKREKNSEYTTPKQTDKSDLSDSFGSWFEWD